MRKSFFNEKQIIFYMLLLLPRGGTYFVLEVWGGRASILFMKFSGVCLFCPSFFTNSSTPTPPLIAYLWHFWGGSWKFWLGSVTKLCATFEGRVMKSICINSAPLPLVINGSLLICDIKCEGAFASSTGDFYLYFFTTYASFWQILILYCSVLYFHNYLIL